MNATSSPILSPGLKALLAVAAFVVVAAGLKAAQTILIPLVLALFLTTLSLPLLNLLRRRVPLGGAVMLTMLFDGAMLAAMGYVVSLSVSRVTARAPRYQERFQQLIASGLEWLQEHGVDAAEWVSPESVGPGPLVDVVSSTFFGVASVLTGAMIVLLLMVFMLFESSGLATKLELALGERGGALRRYAKITREVQRYLVIKTLVSLATGISVALWVWAVGLDFPLLWGILAFAMNYIPNIGSLLAGLPAIGLAGLQLGVPRMLLVALGYLLLNMWWGNLVEPHVMGRRLRISPLVVFTSLIFWGWMWGAIGMLLAVPITMVVKIMLENSASYRWVAALLDTPTR